MRMSADAVSLRSLLRALSTQLPQGKLLRAFDRKIPTPFVCYCDLFFRRYGMPSLASAASIWSTTVGYALQNASYNVPAAWYRLYNTYIEYLPGSKSDRVYCMPARRRGPYTRPWSWWGSCRWESRRGWGSKIHHTRLHIWSSITPVRWLLVIITLTAMAKIWKDSRAELQKEDFFATRLLNWCSAETCLLEAFATICCCLLCCVSTRQRHRRTMTRNMVSLHYLAVTLKASLKAVFGSKLNATSQVYRSNSSRTGDVCKLTGSMAWRGLMDLWHRAKAEVQSPTPTLAFSFLWTPAP